MQATMKKRAVSAFPTRVKPGKLLKPVHQQGVTLIELMVGIAIGLLVVAVALGALMVSRGISGTVSDASNIQQQAAYVMRVIGTQMRQAGSLRVNMDYEAATASAVEPYQAKVAIETYAPASGANNPNSFDPAKDTIKGESASVTVGYRRYKETIGSGTGTISSSLSRNCLGGPEDSSEDQRLESTFVFNASTATLSCGGNNTATSPQPIAQNVADFRIRYLLQDNTTGGNSKIKTASASAVGSSWSQVQGVEVCLELYGNEAIDMPSGSNYVDCSGTTRDMSTLTGARAKRMHMVFRNIFQLRSQGLM